MARRLTKNRERVELAHEIQDAQRLFQGYLARLQIAKRRLKRCTSFFHALHIAGL